jgi:serine/threonine-protein kinase
MARSGPTSQPAGFRDSPDRPIALGDIVAGTYRIGPQLARTDTGMVYEAHDLLIDRLVAFKLAWRDPGTPSLVVEARRCSAVRDLCAVQIHGMGRHHEVEYAVGERVTGTLLRDSLGEGLPGERYLRTLRRLVGAVTRAHESGIAIGDISGSTVLAGDEGRLVLGRLSLSQVPAFGPHGQIVAPEVARGAVDPHDPSAAEAIDIYGLGCIAIEMACGAPPFSEDDRDAALQAHANKPPPRIADLRPDLPVEVADLVEWMLDKHPEGRPRSALDVLSQLEAILDRVGSVTRSIRVLIVDDDTARARWLWGLARRAHAAAIVETASEGTDAAHKLNRDQPDIVFVDASLRGVMNALELCMYARGLESWHHTLGEMYLIGDVSSRDAALFDDAGVQTIAEDRNLANAVMDRVRAAASRPRPRTRASHTKVSG